MPGSSSEPRRLIREEVAAAMVDHATGINERFQDHSDEIDELNRTIRGHNGHLGMITIQAQHGDMLKAILWWVKACAGALVSTLTIIIVGSLLWVIVASRGAVLQRPALHMGANGTSMDRTVSPNPMALGAER